MMGSDLTCLPVLSLSFMWSCGLAIPGVSRPQNFSRPYTMPTPGTLLYGPRKERVLAFEYIRRHNPLKPYRRPIYSPTVVLGGKGRVFMGEALSFFCTPVENIVRLDNKTLVNRVGQFLLITESNRGLLVVQVVGCTPRPQPSEEGTTQNISRPVTRKPSPESGLGCVVGAMFTRKQ